METTTATAETAIAAPPAQPQSHTSASRYSEEQLVHLVAALEVDVRRLGREGEPPDDAHQAPADGYQYAPHRRAF